MTSTSALLADSTGVLATRVRSLRFTFGDVTAGAADYREFDVFGVVSTPEPASLVLFGLGAFGLFALACRRYRSKS